jgi:hypothetical protein
VITLPRMVRVMEYARALRMDAHRVTESYLARYRTSTATLHPTVAAT